MPPALGPRVTSVPPEGPGPKQTGQGSQLFGSRGSKRGNGVRLRAPGLAANSPTTMQHAPERKSFAAAPVRRPLCLLLALAGTLSAGPARACTTCNRPLQEALFGPGFTATLFKMLLPLLLVLLLVRLLYRLKYKETGA